VSEQATQSSAQLPSPTTPGRGTILLGEDDVAVRRLATAILEKDGYTVLGAGDGVAVVQSFEAARDRIALVVLDQNMPGPGVEATLAALSAMQPPARVLLMSGSVLPESGAEIRRFVRGFLAKPFRGGELLRAVEAAIFDRNEGRQQGT
jgi:DNA-binding NtrC family response regulator